MLLYNVTVQCRYIEGKFDPFHLQFVYLFYFYDYFIFSSHEPEQKDFVILLPYHYFNDLTAVWHDNSLTLV